MHSGYWTNMMAEIFKEWLSSKQARRDRSNYNDPFGSPEKFIRYEYNLARDCILPILSDWGVDVKKSKILDLGCGAGGLILALAENVSECLGIDLNPSLIAEASRLAKERSLVAEFASADILNSIERKEG